MNKKILTFLANHSDNYLLYRLYLILSKRSIRRSLKQHYKNKTK